ncbi:MAG: hypothetical protein HQL37_16065 [Alphaproteobacteria bacterium]|nr:hypothetical protein [Alphaproteobacteria bacterium]
MEVDRQTWARIEAHIQQHHMMLDGPNHRYVNSQHLLSAEDQVWLRTHDLQIQPQLRAISDGWEQKRREAEQVSLAEKAQREADIERHAKIISSWQVYPPLDRYVWARSACTEIMGMGAGRYYYLLQLFEAECRAALAEISWHDLMAAPADLRQQIMNDLEAARQNDGPSM